MAAGGEGPRRELYLLHGAWGQYSPKQKAALLLSVGVAGDTDPRSHPEEFT